MGAPHCWFHFLIQASLASHGYRVGPPGMTWSHGQGHGRPPAPPLTSATGAFSLQKWHPRRASSSFTVFSHRSRPPPAAAAAAIREAGNQQSASPSESPGHEGRRDSLAYHRDKVVEFDRISFAQCGVCTGRSRYSGSPALYGRQVGNWSLLNSKGASPTL